VQRGTEAFRFLVRVTKVTRWLHCVKDLSLVPTGWKLHMYRLGRRSVSYTIITFVIFYSLFLFVF